MMETNDPDFDKEKQDEFDEKLGYKPQKTIVYNKILPYSSEIPNETVRQLKDIKENLSKAVILRDIRPASIHWVSKLSRFIKLYGLCFSKSDHILFVKLAYELVIVEDQEFWVTGKFAQLLNILLKKKELLSPEDLELPWRPLANVYLKLFQTSYKSVPMTILPHNAESLLKSTIRYCRLYFPLGASAEILEECRPRFCPYDLSMYKSVSFLEIFLPTMLDPSNAQYGWKLWLNELLDMWSTYHNEPIWSSTVFCLFSRLNWQNIGYIDWEEQLPLIFTRILWQFHLPVKYKKVSLYTKKGLDTWPIAMFIVSNLGGGSKTQSHLDHVFITLESYFHPSNTGCWTRNLNQFQVKLTHYFVQRLHYERYKKPSWLTPVPEWKKLTEEDITAFVKCIQPAANLSVFAKTGSYDAGIVLNSLALLRPEMVIPPILDQLYSALETMTEPHRLIAALQCVVRVARPLVNGGRRSLNDKQTYPEGPTHVIPLLLSSLPGIDPNDINKCMVTLQFIATLVSMVPITDCSAALDEIDDLTEFEQQVCAQTQEFENFIIQFMSKAFSLIDSSSLDNTTGLDRESDGMNLEENMVEIGLSSAFKAILNQAHPKLFDVALECLVNFTNGRCMETKVAGKFVATMCRSAVKADSEKTLKAFLPTVSKLILTLSEYEDAIDDENLDEKLLFNMLLLSELVQAKSVFMTAYIPKITEVLHRTLHLKSRKGYKMASSILMHLLWSLNMTVPVEKKSFKQSWDVSLKEFLPIRNWGVAGGIDELEMGWIEPGKEQENILSSLVNEFLIPELEIINKVCDGDSSISRDRFHQSLIITQDIIFAGGSLPMWNEEPIDLIEMSVARHSPSLILRSTKLEVSLDHPVFPSNVRLAIAQATLRLVDAMIQRQSDDTKAFNFTICILYSVCFIHGVKKDEFELRWRSCQRVKQVLSDNVVLNKKHFRALLIERSILQYEMRFLEGSSLIFTSTHRRILFSLLQLSTSQYSEVRRKGQMTMGAFFKQFPYSYKLIIPKVVETLQKDPTENHKEMKGVLYLIHGCKEKSLIVRRDWDTLDILCPAVISAQHSEKPSIVKLYDCLLKTIARYFETFGIELTVPDAAVTVAQKLLTSSHPAVTNSVVGSEAELEAINKLKARSVVNLETYNSLIQKLVKLFDSGTLLWRRTQICLNMLSMLIRPEVPYPEDAVRVLLSSCIDDNIIIRKAALYFLPKILKNQKRPSKKRKINPSMIGGDYSNKGGDVIPGEGRLDNRWMQYDRKSIDYTEQDWETTAFVHKTWHGWYCWPQEIEVYSAPSDQPNLKRTFEQLSDPEKVIHKFFTDANNVDKLISFLSLEELKGADKFDTRRSNFFKGLFRNFGDTFLDLFEPHLRRLVADSHESSQRCAAEIIAGMMRGTKLWPYASSQRVLTLTCELLKVVFSKVLNETLFDWGQCLMYISMDRDPNRMASIVELFLDDPVRQEEGSFLASSRLLLCQSFFEQQEWRLAEPYRRLFHSLEPHLTNPYKSIRDKIGILMYKIYMSHESCHPKASTLAPHQCDFVDAILPKLAIVIQECGSGGASINELSPSHHPETRHDLGRETSSILQSALVVAPMTASSLEAPLTASSSLQQELLSDLDQPIAPDCPDALEGEDSLAVGESMDLLFVEGGKAPTPHESSSVAILGSGFQPGDSEERKVALRLMNTICKFLISKATFVNTFIAPEVYKFLPHLCQLESIDTDQELRSNCIITLAYLSGVLILPEHLNFVLQTVKTICQGGWWRARIAALSFLQVIVFNNMFSVIESPDMRSLVKGIVLSSLEDQRPEVRQMASQVLSGLFHCNLIIPDEQILNLFSKKLNRNKRRRDRTTGRLIPLSTVDINEKHTGALGLKAFIAAYPYDVPLEMPRVLVTLSEHVNDPQSIADDIKKTLSDFRRTHHDNWRDHKTKFTSDQLSILADVLISPSYYA